MDGSGVGGLLRFLGERTQDQTVTTTNLRDLPCRAELNGAVVDSGLLIPDLVV